MGYIKYLLLYVFACLFYCMYAQTESQIVKDSVYMICVQCDSLYNRICPDNPVIFGDPEQLAQFPGGEEELMSFLRSYIEFPLKCKEQAIQGRVVVKFIIDESGRIICPYVYRTLHPLLDKEAIRVVKLMPDWKPASNNGIPTRTCYTLPIRFKW